MDCSDLWYAKEHHIPVLGHRGIAMCYPENTLPSFEAAIVAGVDLIEFDVNVTKDGQLVVIHDNTIDRTSDHVGRTRDYTLAELKGFDFSYHFPEYRGVQIPTLEEVLTLAANSRPSLLLNVEIKDMYHSTVDETVEMLHRFGLAERSVIACFDAEIIRYTKSTHPEMRCQGFPGREMEHFTDETYDCMFGMGISIRGQGLTDEMIREDIAFCREHGILAWLYCADQEADVLRCLDFGCDNITGNDPRVALEVFRKLGLHN